MLTLHWHTEPLLLGLICGIGWLYALDAFVYRKRWAPGVPLSIPRSISFYLGLLTVYLAVGSPIDQIAERYLFSVHMFQHLLLMYVAPIGLALGFSPARIAAFAQHHPKTARFLRAISHPVLQVGLLTVCFTAWHIPRLYEAALADRAIHVLEHLTLFLPSLLIVFRLLAPNQGLTLLPWPARMLVVFALMVGQLPVFGFLAFTSEPLYPTYIYAPRITDLSPIEDQVLGAVIMKVGGMAFALPLLAICFYGWYLENNRPSPDQRAAIPQTGLIRA
ncbi:MAG: cytochrome c oxidase assembly protein [Puniceicoccaceae bacterium]